jgi:histidinol dehydrogenase
MIPADDDITRVPLRAHGRLATLADADRAAILARAVARDDDAVRTQVAAILEYVRDRGDEALVALTRELDLVKLTAIEVPRAKLDAALAGLAPDVRAALERAAGNLRRASEAARPREVIVETEPGVTVGRRPDALERVGVYAPGGRAAYPSSVLMGVIPAVVAGVREIIVCSPPGADGLPSATVLAAAALAGAHRVFALGGAQAIGAMAYGTDTVPRVERIVGPGNAFVNEAKLQVSSQVGIDSPAGPSEVLIIAEASTPSLLVAREMVAQAEHDPEASVVALIIGQDQAINAVDEALAGLVRGAGRKTIVRQALASRGALLAVDSADEAIAFANAYAAEHLLVAVADAAALLPKLRGHGAIFVGASSSVAFGDYMTGANHVLPTGGLARSFSGLSTESFMRWTSWQSVTPAAAARLAADTAVLADAEGLPGHAAAARGWEGA